jgi:acylphosphatase
MASQRRHIRFFGDVQGVGFRYVTCRTAGGFDVTGYVRNLPDSSVECLVEGEAAEIDAFLGALCQRMSGHIDRHTQETGAFTGVFKSFDVRF